MTVLQKGLILIEDERILIDDESNNLKKSKSITQQKQDSIRNEVGITFLYGVGPDAHRTNDAFAYLIRSLQSYSNTL